jgi:flagellar biosynthesis/type III secretory pathway protein FliH
MTHREIAAAVIDSINSNMGAAGPLEDVEQDAIYEAVERAYQLGWSNGHDHGSESMRSWMQGGYE